MAPTKRQVRTRAGEPPHGICDPALYRSQPWHMAYMAALFEADRAKVGDRITSAEQLIRTRARELFYAPSNLAEQNLLNTALSALRSLRTCLELQSWRGKCG